jgi:hypothetical protein
MKFFFRQGPCPVDDSDELVFGKKMSILEELEQARSDLETAYCGFDNATDPDLIDCYIYEVNAIMKRYKYLLERAAEMTPLPDEKRPERFCTPVY